MPHRKKILIIENDDFLREIIGNLLHKEGIYILNGFSVEEGLREGRGKKIDTVILGTSCRDYEGKKTTNYIQKELGDLNLFILNTTETDIDFVPTDMQMKTSELSIKDIIQKLA